MGPRKNASLPSSFWALNWSQFLGAMNDNLFRGIMALALITRAGGPIHGETSETPLFLAGIIFSAPFILFSSTAGILADRFSKRSLILLTNSLEVGVMVLGLVAFSVDSPLLIYIVLFLMATQSTLFGPCKLGILPELVAPTKLSKANGIMEMFCYLAIIFGTVGAAAAYSWCFAGTATTAMIPCWKAAILCVAMSIIGLCFSLFIKDTGVRSSGKRATPLFWCAIYRNLKACQGKPFLALSLFAIGFFLFLGGYVQLNLVPYGVEILGLSKGWAFNLFLALAIGIGLGSYLAGKLSGEGIEIGLVPAGALIFSVMLILLFFTVWNVASLVVILFAMGLGGGLYIVPLYAFIQHEAPEEDRGELIATSYFLSFLGLAAASVLLLIFDQVIGLAPNTRFLFLGIGTIALTAWAIRLLPDFFVCFLGSIGVHGLYRLKVIGRENIPRRGGALLVANHVAFSDAALLVASLTRRIRFIMDRPIYEKKGWNWLYRLMGVIPISEKDGPKDLARALKKARMTLDEGYLVCLFAEGAMTRTGQVMGFKRGLERIVRNTQHPVIPVHLQGLWGSPFSHGSPRLFGRRGGRRPVKVSFGKPMSSQSSAFEVRQAVMALGTGTLEDRLEPLSVEFIRTARKRWSRPCVSDTTDKNLSFGQALTAAFALAAELEKELIESQRVGVLLPTSVGGALANVTLSFMKKTPVNLNFTASTSALRSAVKLASITRIITSREFVARADLPDLPGFIFLEDRVKAITPLARFKAYLKARFCPLRLLARGRSLDDTAAILFSSGSSGEPKGVVLTEANLLANITAVLQVYRLKAEDVLCATLPFFHSFGFMGTLWLPLLAGMKVVFHPRPMDVKQVGMLVARNRCTFMVTTPTFLMGYLRKVSVSDFASLRLMVTGAEKLEKRLASAFEKRFGLLPLEGYGATELSPVACVNVPDMEINGVAQAGNRPGSVGRPLPGVAVSVVDPKEPTRLLGSGEEGLLLVQGPNLMAGYLNDSRETARVIQNGWYRTGDLARIDADGFVRITGRLSRFSKIAGEMIPHTEIEKRLNEGLNSDRCGFAVTALPDEKKGEQLVVLHTLEAADVQQALEKLKRGGLPNLWIPAACNFLRVQQLPTLGSGKRDLQGLKNLAGEMLRLRRLAVTHGR